MKITNQFKPRLRTYFVKRLGGYDYRHGWMRIPTCPYCGREHKLGVNLSMYRTNCFRCNAHPSPAQLIMDIEGFTEYHELINFLNNGQFDELQFKEEKIELAESKPVYLPEGFRNISLGDSQLAKSIRGYVKKRGFSLEKFSRYGIGYGTSGSTYGYLIIPFYYRGQLRYYNARNVIGKGPRYNNPDKDITGLGKQFIIFNHDALEMYRSVFICEGALMLSQLGIEQLPQWVKLLVSTKSMSYLNPNAKDLLYCWTQTQKNMPSTWLSSLLHIKKSRWCFYQTEKT